MQFSWLGMAAYLVSANPAVAPLEPLRFSSWSTMNKCLFMLAIVIGLKALAWIVLHGVGMLLGRKAPIEVRGKHLDELSTTDHAFVAFNRYVQVPFVTFHIMQYCYTASNVRWEAEELTVANTVGALAFCFALYDFVYYWFHYFLHHRALYQYVHKHHHRQMAPSRGNEDAVNVHPFEFGCGEYLHLLALYCVPSIHVYAIALFIITAGIFASLNHTRHDVHIGPSVEGMGALYSVKAHDVHHHIYNYNYGQYTMLWDHVFGSYKPWNAALSTKKK